MSYHMTIKTAGLTSSVFKPLVRNLGSNAALYRVGGGAGLGAMAGGTGGLINSVRNPTDGSLDWRDMLRRTAAGAIGGATVGAAVGGFQGQGLHRLGQRGGKYMTGLFDSVRTVPTTSIPTGVMLSGRG
jgi:hypothetical protein